MLVPAGIYLLFNAGTPAAGGWGVPMATDIAFAVGILALLGKRVPPALRILLLALAVIDDLGAIIVIAIFYSSGISVGGLAIVAAGLLLILLMQKLGVRSPWAYVVPGVWPGRSLRAACTRRSPASSSVFSRRSGLVRTDQFVDRASAAIAAVRRGAAGGHRYTPGCRT